MDSMKMKADFGHWKNTKSRYKHPPEIMWLMIRVVAMSVARLTTTSFVAQELTFLKKRCQVVNDEKK